MFDLVHEQETGFAVNNGDERLLMILADDEVTFEIADNPPVFNGFRTFIDGFSFGNDAPFIKRSITFAQLLLAAQMRPQEPPARLSA